MSCVQLFWKSVQRPFYEDLVVGGLPQNTLSFLVLHGQERIEKVPEGSLLDALKRFKDLLGALCDPLRIWKNWENGRSGLTVMS
jgi:hypothetical protein